MEDGECVRAYNSLYLKHKTLEEQVKDLIQKIEKITPETVVGDRHLIAYGEYADGVGDARRYILALLRDALKK